MEVFQLEVSLYEDMAALWNSALHANNLAERHGASKLDVKNAGALLRATAKATFNLLEGYVNGLASDILLTKSITDEERAKLQEWDSARSRARHLSLRDKLLQYPKIAIAASHPPIDDAATPSMRNVIQMEVKLRHALIHPRPEWHLSDRVEFRERAFFELSLSDVGRLCDDVIDLIERIAGVVGNEYGDVSLWLFHRAPGGFFPESTFF